MSGKALLGCVPPVPSHEGSQEEETHLPPEGSGPPGERALPTGEADISGASGESAGVVTGPGRATESPPASEPTPAGTAKPGRPVPFVLRDPGVPHERSARPGDGVWRDFFSSEFDADHEQRTESQTPSDFARALVQRIVLHPHPTSRFQTLTLAAFDLSQLRVDHHPGMEDVVDVGRKDLKPRAGLVPQGDWDSLLAVFNGGFQPRHGRWGMLSLGEQLIPPREDACTVAILADGTVTIAPWTQLESEKEQLVAYRQTPPCLATEGKLHPLLGKSERGPWAGQQPSRKTRRRSVVGVSRNGRVLYVGLGSETEPEVLAAGMLHAGAHVAAQLDINWNWTRLFLFESAGETVPQLRGALVPDMVKNKGEYLERPATRGFFSVHTRTTPRVFPEPAP